MTKEKRDSLSLPVLDPKRVEYYRFAHEWTPGQFKEKALLTDEGLQKIRRGKPIAMQKARKVAAAFGVPLLEILHPRQLLQLMPDLGTETPSKGLPDWPAESPMSGPVTKSNGLKYHIWKLKHIAEEGRFARGKRYDLQAMRAPDQQRLSVYLARHGEVCNKVAGLRFFPRHITTTPDPDGKAWWSVDEWTEGETLGDLVYRDAIPAKAKASIMRNLAKGLKTLHEAGIICRELTPESVIVADVEQGAVVLTDFELGKMLEGRPTVRGNLPPNPYQPKEVEGKKLVKGDTHVDWYSWGRILVHVVAGGLPPKKQEGPCLEQADLPDRVKNLVAKCLSPDPPARPRKAEEILGGIRWWR
jgi:serine/threonine protein kinase